MGLSVWLWGPTFWSILHTVAFYSDTSQLYDSDLLVRFFEHVEPLLPCPYCSESYGRLLKETGKVMGELSLVIQKRQLTKFVFTLHEQVNRKLLFQKFSTLQKDVPALQSIDREIIWKHMNSQPPLAVVYKRQEFAANEPLSLDSVWILLLALVQRSTSSDKQLLTFISILGLTANASEFQASQDMAKRLRQSRKPTELFEAYHQWLQGQKGRKIKYDKFMHTLQYKLDRMLSTGCSSGTCK
jgi:hypothetical protein